MYITGDKCVQYVDKWDEAIELELKYMGD